jgi:hypothetical protein
MDLDLDMQVFDLSPRQFILDACDFIDKAHRLAKVHLNAIQEAKVHDVGVYDVQADDDSAESKTLQVSKGEFFFYMAAIYAPNPWNAHLELAKDAEGKDNYYRRALMFLHEAVKWHYQPAIDQLAHCHLDKDGKLSYATVPLLVEGLLPRPNKLDIVYHFLPIIPNSYPIQTF